ncbi:MAG: magnesium-translocating P-type ATPase [Burkholderiaceae bacterium]
MNRGKHPGFFARFLHSRAIHRLFRRIALLESFEGAAISRDVPAPLAQTLSAAARSEPQALLKTLHAHPDGLTEAEARAARRRFGPNEVEHEKPLPAWQHLWHCYQNPFNLLLTVLAAISAATDDTKAAIVISTMVVLSTGLRFWQENRSHQAADKLKALVSSTATVLRRDRAGSAKTSNEGATPGNAGPRQIELPIRQLVPGDVLLMSAGDMIPADLRLLAAKDLFVGQSAMTGESMPVEKFPMQRDPKTINPLELDSILFMGTNVVSGSATALVLATGSHTYFGALAQRASSTDRSPTSFQTGVNRVSWLLIRFMALMVPLVLLLNGFTKGDWLQALLFALSIAVGLTPEMLPMIVTSTLARGAVFLSRKKVIVKRLDAIQNFGAMDVLCTDKTGTLTQDRIVLAQHPDAWGDESAQVLKMVYLNSYYQTGLKNLLDVAVLKHAEVHHELDVVASFSKVDEMPFDFSRRRMSVVVAERDQRHLLICKGAVEEILAVCTAVRRGEADEPLTQVLLERQHALTKALNAQGLRVVAVAVKALPPEKNDYGIADETGLTLVGYVAFLDPPKETTAPALAALARHGVTVKILTGDNEAVTAKICHDVGLAPGVVLLGSDIEALDDTQLAISAEKTTVFAKLTPAHKERIVRLLKGRGHVVGYMGDGINDAAALRVADIGISVDTAVDIAKEAADIILLEKNLLVLDQGVLEGRRTFVNMLKYIKMTASSNFGNVLSVLVASAFIPFLPMLPMHLLVQNLLYDVSQSAIPFDNVDSELLNKPLHWQPAEIGRFMLYFGPVSSVFDLATFGLMWFVFGASSVAQQTLFQSGWFVMGVLTQTLIVHMIRTPLIPFAQSRAATPLLVMTSLIMAVGVFLPMGPLAHWFKLQALPPVFFAYVAAMLAGYVALTQAMKAYYIRHFGWQ